MEQPRICVLIPVYNHGITVATVLRNARKHLPVIVVNDGSTDETASRLAEVADVNVVTLTCNKGKGAALRAGFLKADEMGFTHAITIDADGQHSTDALPGFIEVCKSRPEALIVGIRDLKQANAPLPRRATNSLSNFWVKVETGIPLQDTQCGYRCYPIKAVRSLELKCERYAFELEVLVKAAWAGIPLVPHPTQADYAAPTSRLSHFHPWRDMIAMSWLHSHLSFLSFCLPLPLRKLLVSGNIRSMSLKQRIITIVRHLFLEHAESRTRRASAVGLGLFCGIAPIWGFQMLAAATLAHKLRLNKAIALAASNISIPLTAPFIIAASLALGHFLFTGELLDFSPAEVSKHVPVYLFEWFFGSFVLAIVVALIGGLGVYALSSLSRGDSACRTSNE